VVVGLEGVEDEPQVARDRLRGGVLLEVVGADEEDDGGRSPAG